MSKFRGIFSNSWVDTDLMTEPKLCRFCLSTKATRVNPFLSPCNCKGSLEFVHLKCLNRWRRIDVVRNGAVCSLCLGNYTFLMPFQLEQLPQKNTIVLYCLNYPGLILLIYNYIYSIAISSSRTFSDYFFLQHIYVVSQYVFHFVYFSFLFLEWNVFNKDLYWKQLINIWTPFLIGIHIYMFHLLQEDAYFLGPILSFYMGLYWRSHLRILQNINIHLHNLEDT